MAIIQGTMLYASELTWGGGRGVEGEQQVAINRMDKATLGPSDQHRLALWRRKAASPRPDPS